MVKRGANILISYKKGNNSFSCFLVGLHTLEIFQFSSSAYHVIDNNILI